MKCLHCETEFEQRFGREKCCSKRCAAFIREEKHRKSRKSKIKVNDFLRGSVTSLGKQYT